MSHDQLPAGLLASIDELERSLTLNALKIQAIRRVVREIIMSGNSFQEENEKHRISGSSRYEIAIVEILSSKGARLTLGPLMDAMHERGLNPTARTIKRYLKKLALDGLIDNNRIGSDLGYGLVVTSDPCNMSPACHLPTPGS